MDKVGKIFVTGFAALGGIFVFAMISPLFGGIAGWVVGLFFGDTILGILGQLGVHNVTMFQFGAFMGFVGGFLKTKVTAQISK